MTAGTGEQDVVDILTTDHHEVLDLIGEAKATSDATQRRDIADTVIAEIMRHSIAEEMYVYPAMSKHLPKGEETVEHDKKEHQELEEAMKALEGVDGSSAEFETALNRVEELLRHHANDEETEQFPQLRANIPEQELVEIGKKVETAKKAAPTRPHPGAPHSELFHKAVGPGVGMIDKLRDKLTGRSTG
jgi:hemerythrin-like domain-containing protein